MPITKKDIGTVISISEQTDELGNPIGSSRFFVAISGVFRVFDFQGTEDISRRHAIDTQAGLFTNDSQSGAYSRNSVTNQIQSYHYENNEWNTLPGQDANGPDEDPMFVTLEGRLFRWDKEGTQVRSQVWGLDNQLHVVRNISNVFSPTTFSTTEGGTIATYSNSTVSKVGDVVLTTDNSLSPIAGAVESFSPRFTNFHFRGIDNFTVRKAELFGTSSNKLITYNLETGSEISRITLPFSHGNEFVYGSIVKFVLGDFDESVSSDDPIELSVLEGYVTDVSFSLPREQTTVSAEGEAVRVEIPGKKIITLLTRRDLTTFTKVDNTQYVIDNEVFQLVSAEAEGRYTYEVVLETPEANG